MNGCWSVAFSYGNSTFVQVRWFVRWFARWLVCVLVRRVLLLFVDFPADSFNGTEGWGGVKQKVEELTNKRGETGGD